MMIDQDIATLHCSGSKLALSSVEKLGEKKSSRAAIKGVRDAFRMSGEAADDVFGPMEIDELMPGSG